MNRFRQSFNRTFNRDRSSSPAAPTNQAHLKPFATSTPKSWTTHDSNLALFECLSTATPARPALPAELILKIVSLPSRWVSLHSIRHSASSDPSQPIVKVRGDGISGIPVLVPVLSTRPLSAREVERLREVVFTFRSRDQGYCDNRDGGTWSWFEASLARLSRADEDVQGPCDDAAEWTGSYERTGEWVKLHEQSLECQPKYQIQSNVCGSTEVSHYTIGLTDEHELVQHVQEGDRVILWACARFREWENRVYEAKITVLGVDDLTDG
ncbi:hypothetical protein BDR22DRAFT_883792 [Usnea florida]